jgi:phosphoesterase RecJ-like protein
VNSTALQIQKLLLNKSYVAIIPHQSPDGDAIGSAIALKLYIQQFHKNVDIFCVDEAPKNTHFLPESKTIKQTLDLDTYKTLCFVDCGNHKLSKYTSIHPELLSRQDLTTINIDHHESNDNFAKFNLVDTKSASTTQILYKLFTDWKTKITPEMANALLTGLHFDTGSFKHPNTTPETLKIASSLTELGGNNTQISKNLFNTSSSNKLKLWGKALQNINLNSKNIVSTVIRQQDLAKYNTNKQDLEGLIDYLNAIPNKKFSLLLTEFKKNKFKASLRTLDPKYNLNDIAKLFGGGGHKMASAFKINAKLTPTTYWKVE